MLPVSSPVPSPVPAAGNGVAARTREQLLRGACELIRREGHVPTISDVAEVAGVSRATAYRYFRSRSKLIAAVVDFSLGPVRRFASVLPQADARLEELFRTTFTRFKEFEPQMRSALQLSLEHGALAASGRLEEEAYRRGYRVAILRRTFAPLRATMSAGAVERLCKAVSVVYGIEPYVVLKDIWGCSDEEVGEIAYWTASALLRQAVADAARARPSAAQAAKSPAPKARRGARTT